MLLAACASPPGPLPPPAAAGAAPGAWRPDGRSVPESPGTAVDSSPLDLPVPPAPAGDEPVWSVDGRALTKADLGDFVLRYMPDRAAEALDQILDEAVIGAEAAREGVAASGAEVDARTDAYVEDRRREARVQFGASTDFEKVLRERYGRDLAGFRADSRRLVRAVLLRDRLVRLDELRDDGVDLRVIVLPTEAAALDAVASLRAGADMTLYAEKVGARRPSAPPPAARGEIPEKDLEAALFAASAGDVLDPVPFEVRGRGRFWQVFKVVRTWRGSKEAWAGLRHDVETSLAASPVTEEEYRRWRRRAYARHRIESHGAAKGSIPAPRGE